MKKKIIIGSAVVLGLIALVYVVNMLRGGWITPSQVERATFRGFSSCQGPVSDTVELTDSEIRQLATYYNLSTYAGPVTGEGCDSDFGFTLYLEDGTQLGMREAESPRIHVNPPEGDSYWVKGPLLVSYANELIEKYNLEVS